MLIKSDCKHLDGEVPCKPHKLYSVHCDNCSFYKKRGERILLIKLDGIGDVIRTTPIIRKLKEVYPDSEITWLTLSPDFVPKIVDVPLFFNETSIRRLQADEFDLLINLDKRIDVCALTNLVKAKVKKGFMLKDGKCAPIDDDAYAKYLNGLFDDISQANSKSYVEEMFEIAGLPYNHEKYLIDRPENPYVFPQMKGPVIGLNTGSGVRWLETRTWADEMWIEVAIKLQEKGYSVVMLGGELEHEKNVRIAAKSGAYYFGHFSMKDFVALVDRCDLVVTSVTSAMHIVIGLEKKIVLFVNIFPKAEFDLYDLGIILEPPKKCVCFYKSKCSVYPGSSCMQDITTERVLTAVDALLAQKINNADDTSTSSVHQ